MVKNECLKIAMDVFNTCNKLNKASRKHRIYTSFLYFASETLNNQSIYPYWSDMDKLDKDLFLMIIFERNIPFYKKIHKFILLNKQYLWNYMEERISLTSMKYTKSQFIEICLTQPTSIILSIFRNWNIKSIVYANQPFESKFIMRLTYCDEFSYYVKKLCKKILDQSSDEYLYNISFLCDQFIEGRKIAGECEAFIKRVNEYTQDH